MKVITLDIDPQMIAIALDTFTKHEMTGIIKLIEGPAAETLQSQIRGEFDIIFIDADKPGYKKYLQIILDKGLLNKNGIIITDNSKPLSVLGTLTSQYSLGALSWNNQTRIPTLERVGGTKTLKP
jgi:predicted O-methyltransferase YrrM